MAVGNFKKYEQIIKHVAWIHSFNDIVIAVVPVLLSDKKGKSSYVPELELKTDVRVVVCYKSDREFYLMFAEKYFNFLEYRFYIPFEYTKENYYLALEIAMECVDLINKYSRYDGVLNEEYYNMIGTKLGFVKHERGDNVRTAKEIEERKKGWQSLLRR